jgi:hypothetical protein
LLPCRETGIDQLAHLSGKDGIATLAAEARVPVEADNTDRSLAFDRSSDSRRAGDTEAAAQLDGRNTLLDHGFGRALGLGIVGDSNDGKVDLLRADHGAVLGRVGSRRQEDEGCLQ